MDLPVRTIVTPAAHGGDYRALEKARKRQGGEKMTGVRERDGGEVAERVEMVRRVRRVLKG